MKIYHCESIARFGSRGGRHAVKHSKKLIRWYFRLKGERFWYPIPYVGLSFKRVKLLACKIAGALRFSICAFMCETLDDLPF